MNTIKMSKSGQRTEPSNKRIQRQQNFYSTKRKCQRARVRLAKPTFLQKAKISNQLLLTADKSLPLSCIGKYGTSLLTTRSASM